MSELVLIDGEIIEMSPIGRFHAAQVKRLNKLFLLLLGDRVLVGVQHPIELSARLTTPTRLNITSK